MRANGLPQSTAFLPMRSIFSRVSRCFCQSSGFMRSLPAARLELGGGKVATEEKEGIRGSADVEAEATLVVVEDSS